MCVCVYVHLAMLVSLFVSLRCECVLVPETDCPIKVDVSGSMDRVTLRALHHELRSSIIIVLSCADNRLDWMI